VRLAVIRPATVVILLLLAASLGTAAAQPREKMSRIGYLSPGFATDPIRARFLEAFRHGLRELGYVEGQNIAIESRWTEGVYDRYPDLAADLVRLKVDVIVVSGGAATQATRQATRTIPIVMLVVNDPVGSGFVASLARPGGNVTGNSVMASDLVGKQLELVRSCFPRFRRSRSSGIPTIQGARSSCDRRRLRLEPLECGFNPLAARVPQEIDSAFAAMTRESTGALLMFADALFTNQRRQIAELAAKRRLPSVYGIGEYAEAGGLMTYSASYLDLFRRAATFVDKILRGAKPADLPVEQPTKFELVINRASRES
jgi:putative ABC transport system substrate-binding protein